MQSKSLDMSIKYAAEHFNFLLIVCQTAVSAVG